MRGGNQLKAGDRYRMTVQGSLFDDESAVARAVANVDGGSRGNPGPAGYGARIVLDDGTVVDLKETIGIATNNVAEYNGLLAALRWAVANGVGHLHVRADSELLIKQMKGVYRGKNPGLQLLFQDAQSLVGRLPRVTFEHVRRELNKDADRLANEAMDAAEGVLGP
jgi:ribonuclease HI